MNLAAAIDAVPVVQSTAERGVKFAAPATDQRVFNKETKSVERYDGAAWLIDFGSAAQSLGWFNIKDAPFNAKVDGATDDTAAAQAAVVAAEAVGGGEVHIGRGITKWVGAVTVSMSYITLAGDGPGATVINFAPTASGPCVLVDGAGGSAVTMFRLRGVKFQSTDVAFTKEMVRLVNVRDVDIASIGSQDGLWNGVGSMGLRIYGRDLIRVTHSQFYAEQPLKIEVNPDFAANALDYATFEHVQFAVQAGVNAYNVELADGVTWSNCVWRDCDGARGLGFARWTDTTSTGASFMNKFEGVRQEQSVAGATYTFDLGSTVQQLQGTVFNRVYNGTNINGIKMRRAFSTSMDTIFQVGGDALNFDAASKGLKIKNILLLGATTTGLNLVTGFVEISNPETGNVSGDRGDANVAIVALVDSPTQRFTSALTANRTVTLSATNAHRGAKFRVVRSGLGAFTLDVGGLKVIPAGTAAFVDVEHDGTAWRLVAYGTL